jgi:hypothetical protein
MPYPIHSVQILRETGSFFNKKNAGNRISPSLLSTPKEGRCTASHAFMPTLATQGLHCSQQVAVMLSRRAVCGRRNEQNPAATARELEICGFRACSSQRQALGSARESSRIRERAHAQRDGTELEHVTVSKLTCRRPPTPKLKRAGRQLSTSHAAGIGWTRAGVRLAAAVHLKFPFYIIFYVTSLTFYPLLFYNLLSKHI